MAAAAAAAAWDIDECRFLIARSALSSSVAPTSWLTALIDALPAAVSPRLHTKLASNLQAFLIPKMVKANAEGKCHRTGFNNFFLFLCVCIFVNNRKLMKCNNDATRQVKQTNADDNSSSSNNCDSNNSNSCNCWQ